MNVGIVGCGEAGIALARGAQELGHAIVAVADSSRTRANDATEMFGAEATTWKQLLNRKGLDAVAVATPTDTQSPYVLDALNAEIAVAVAGPLCRTPQEAKTILQTARSTGAPIVVASCRREARAVDAIVNQYKAGRAGTAGFIRVTQKNPAPAGAKLWYRDAEKSGGVIVQQLAADIEWIAGLLGEPSRVFAQCARKTGRNFFEYALVTLRFPSGALVQLVGSWAMAEGRRTTIEICGDGGMIQFDSADHAVDFEPRGTGSFAEDDTAYTHVWERLAKGDHPEHLESAVRAIAIVELAVRSAATGRAVVAKARKGARS